MAKYFTVSQGLRGCYMPDNCYTVKVETRRELRDIIASEAYYFRDAGFIGGNKRAVSWLAATAWREAQKTNPAYLPFVLPMAQHKGNYCYGIFVSTACRRDYLDQETGD